MMKLKQNILMFSKQNVWITSHWNRQWNWGLPVKCFCLVESAFSNGKMFFGKFLTSSTWNWNASLRKFFLQPNKYLIVYFCRLAPRSRAAHPVSCLQGCSWCARLLALNCSICWWGEPPLGPAKRQKKEKGRTNLGPTNLDSMTLK